MGITSLWWRGGDEVSVSQMLSGALSYKNVQTTTSTGYVFGQQLLFQPKGTSQAKASRSSLEAR